MCSLEKARAHTYFLSALLPTASRAVSPLSLLSAFASLGKLEDKFGVGSVFWDRSFCTAGDVFVLWRICYATMHC